MILDRAAYATAIAIRKLSPEQVRVHNGKKMLRRLNVYFACDMFTKKKLRTYAFLACFLPPSNHRARKGTTKYSGIHDKIWIRTSIVERTESLFAVIESRYAADNAMTKLHNDHPYHIMYKLVPSEQMGWLG